MKTVSLSPTSETEAGFAGTSTQFRMSDNYNYVSNLFAQNPGGADSSPEELNQLRLKFGLPVLNSFTTVSANEKQQTDEAAKMTPALDNGIDPTTGATPDFGGGGDVLGIGSALGDFVTVYGARIAIYVLGIILMLAGIILFLVESPTVQKAAKEAIKSGA